MAKSNEAQNKSAPDAADKKAQQDKIIAKNSPKKSSAFSAPALTMTMAAIALIAALYATYSNLQSRQLSHQQTKNLNAAMDSLKQQQSDTKTNFEGLKETINHAKTRMQTQVKELNTNLQSAMQQRLYQKQDWLLLKARYYLELAQINAHWSDDQQATVALLQQADALLVTIPDQHLFAVRQAIAKEITQLQSLPKLDITGLLSQLDAAQSEIAKLPIKQPVNAVQANNQKSSEHPPSSPWRERLKDSLNALEKIVVIRHNNEDIEPILSPLHQTLLRDSIHLNLQEAQWAILQNNAKVYQLSLTQAVAAIKRAFDENAVSVQALIKQLQTLQQEKFVTTRPLIKDSLSLLNQWIDAKNSQAGDNSDGKAGDKTP